MREEGPYAQRSHDLYTMPDKLLSSHKPLSRGMRSLGLLLISVLFLIGNAASAQVGVPNIGSDLTIALSPDHPSANTLVHLVARTALIDLSKSRLVWTANGKVIAEGVGVTSADVVVGDAGTELDVILTVKGNDGTELSTAATIIPASVDILVESDSYTPPFYRGRALPSAGTNLRLEAIPHFSREGSPVDGSELLYTWRRNGSVIAAVSGKGSSRVTIPAPHLFSSDRISVEVRAPDDAQIGEASVRIPSVEPHLALYENHPLFGFRHSLALGASTFIPDAEMSFQAVPYFSEARSASDPLLHYAWRVNEVPVAGDTAKPSELTINAANSNGVALISLELTHATNFYIQSAHTWNVTFSSNVSDQFHNPSP